MFVWPLACACDQGRGRRLDDARHSDLAVAGTHQAHTKSPIGARFRPGGTLLGAGAGTIGDVISILLCTPERVPDLFEAHPVMEHGRTMVRSSRDLRVHAAPDCAELTPQDAAAPLGSAQVDPWGFHPGDLCELCTGPYTRQWATVDTNAALTGAFAATTLQELMASSDALLMAKHHTSWPMRFFHNPYIPADALADWNEASGEAVDALMGRAVATAAAHDFLAGQFAGSTRRRDVVLADMTTAYNHAHDVLHRLEGSLAHPLTRPWSACAEELLERLGRQAALLRSVLTSIGFEPGVTARDSLNIATPTPIPAVGADHGPFTVAAQPREVDLDEDIDAREYGWVFFAGPADQAAKLEAVRWLWPEQAWLSEVSTRPWSTNVDEPVTVAGWGPVAYWADWLAQMTARDTHIEVVVPRRRPFTEGQRSPVQPMVVLDSSRALYLPQKFGAFLHADAVDAFEGVRTPSRTGYAHPRSVRLWTIDVGGLALDADIVMRTGQVAARVWQPQPPTWRLGSASGPGTGRVHAAAAVLVADATAL